MAYATPAELAAWLDPEPAPDNAVRLLSRASRRVSRATVCAVYDVDDAGTPTDTKVTDALREATLEQVSYWLDNGDDEGTGAAVTSASIGSASLTYAGAGGGADAASQLCNEAWGVLESAGLTGFGPQVRG